ncbi:dihydroxyacetone kinase subunit DhaK [Consotaella aegiceratis]|uniref:dihydroxyacetone kinase subunit DhaK n=1 Tax=Consotaella aegiceratis TaxID=3097961 RepID=UPI002F415CFC
MKKLINEVDAVVTEQLEGLAAAYPSLRVNYDPKFVVRSDGPVSDKVALVSGGGSGHEPMHAGLVGPGMLDGAVPGEMFTSPTPDQVLECAMAADGGKGVLLIIKNYTGDVLNFETALELAHDAGTQVASVLVDEDVAVKDSLYTAGRRGVAGTVLVEKLVGAAAAEGRDLDACATLGNTIVDQMRSFGVALSACTVPAAGKPSFELAENEVEFGVGIHGEPGIGRAEYSSVDPLVAKVFEELLSNGGYSRTRRTWNRDSGAWDEAEAKVADLNSGDRVLLFVNGLGGTPSSELFGVYRAAVKECEKAGLKVERNLVGDYCTSLDMEGFSITVLKLDDELVKLWDAPVATPAMHW